MLSIKSLILFLFLISPRVKLALFDLTISKIYILHLNISSFEWILIFSSLMTGLYFSKLPPHHSLSSWSWSYYIYDSLIGCLYIFWENSNHQVSYQKHIFLQISGMHILYYHIPSWHSYRHFLYQWIFFSNPFFLQNVSSLFFQFKNVI